MGQQHQPLSAPFLFPAVVIVMPVLLYCIWNKMARHHDKWQLRRLILGLRVRELSFQLSASLSMHHSLSWRQLLLMLMHPELH